MEQVKEEAMAAPYDLLLGRKTYELFAVSPNTERMKNATKYVATSNVSELSWENTVPITGDIASEVARLKTEDGPLLQLHGSWQLIQTLLAHDLIDEFRLWVFPVVVGSGKRIFGGGTVPTGLTLVKTRATAHGAVMCIYRRSESQGVRA
jgi:dihydrofolate reductase